MAQLDGIKVLDLSLFLPGPMATMMMADQGAEVTKIEPVAGDPARDMPPMEAGQSVWFRSLNRGKKSIALDLKSEEGKAQLRALIADADVFVEGFRPGVMARLGFDYDAVSAINPRIVYCSISAFGQEGTMAQHPAHDLAVQALAGFLSMNDGADGVPAVPGVAAGDMAAGLTALSAILMALIGREKSGRGDYIDATMFDALLPWGAHTAGSAIAGGAAPRSGSQRSLGGAAFYSVYRTKDARFVVLGAREMKFVRNLLEALGRPDLIELGEAGAGEPQAPLRAFLAETFATKTRDEWAVWFADRDVAFAPVLDFREALDSDLVAERGMLVERNGTHQIGPAIRFLKEPGLPVRPAPELDQDG